MNATFGLGISSPTAGTRILSGLNSLSACPATNAWVTVIMQRIIWKVVCLDMFPHLIACPCCERIKLDHLIGIIPFDKSGIGAEGGLVTADTGNPGIVVCKKLSLRNHFANVATSIGVTIP